MRLWHELTLKRLLFILAGIFFVLMAALDPIWGVAMFVSLIGGFILEINDQ